MTDPSANATPVNVPERVRLDPGETARVTYTPEQSGSEFIVPIVAMSKHEGSTYEIRTDGTVRFDERPVPPTDVDDLGQTFYPPLTFRDSLEIVIRNVSAGTLSYILQPIGWEEPEATETGTGTGAN